MMLHVRQVMCLINVIFRRLAELQYKRNDAVFERGTFRVRGEVIDVFRQNQKKLFDLSCLMVKWKLFHHLIRL